MLKKHLIIRLKFFLNIKTHNYEHKIHQSQFRRDSLQTIRKPKRHARPNRYYEIPKQPASKPQQNLKGRNRGV